MQAPTLEKIFPFSYEALREIYQRIDFPSRAKTLQLFMATDAPILIKIPPCPWSIFSERTKNTITVLSYLLGHHSDQWFYEAVIFFLSILSSEAKPTIMFNYSQFLGDAIDKQFLEFNIEEVFKYTSVLVYMFVYFKSRRFPFQMNKENEDYEPQFIIF